MEKRIVNCALKSTLILCLLIQIAWAQGKCPKAESLSAGEITENSAVLSWIGGDDVITYNVHVMHGLQTTPLNFSATTSEMSLSVEGLSAGSKYRFRVMTKCDKGSGGSSQWMDFTTLGESDSGPGNNGNSDGNATPKGPCPKASNLAILEIDDTSAMLGWLGNDQNVSYQVDVHQKEHTPVYKLTETTDTTMLYIGGLVPGGNYKFRVKAKCEKNSAGSSSWINFTTTGGDTTFQQCPKPTNLSVLEVSDSSALLAWVARDSAESFTLDVKSYQATAHFNLNVTIVEDSFLVEGLQPDGDYHFRVVATCIDGSTSGSSDWSKFRTLTSDTTATDDDSGEEDGEEDEEDNEENIEQEVTFISETSIVTFPNPAVETITVELPTKELGFLTEIILSDVNGRIVYHTKLNGVPSNDRLPIPVQNLRNGIYTLMIKSVNFHQTKTILVQH